MKLAFLDYFTEHCRHNGQGETLAAAIAKHGHVVVNQPDHTCDLVLCGSIFKSELARGYWRSGLDVPIVNYNWDLYSWVWREPHGDPLKWKRYKRMLNRSKEIWCPSQCTIIRSGEHCPTIPAYRILSSVWTWETNVRTPGDYVVDVMRKYHDPNRDMVQSVCEELGIPCVAPDHTLGFEEFKQLIGGARVLVSAYAEASTGGLSLIEGHYHGKPVLISNSPWHGGVDYFGDRATYFQWDSRDDFKEKLQQLWNDPPSLDREECRNWVDTNFSVDRMASDIHHRLVALQNEPNRPS